MPSSLHLQIPLPRLSSTPTPSRSTPARTGPGISLEQVLLTPLGHPAVHAEEGRLHVILSTVGHAVRGGAADADPLLADRRDALRDEVLAHLIGRLRDARIEPAERQFLQTLSERLVSAVLDGAYAGLLGNGGPRDTLAKAILEPQDLRVASMLRTWTIGDVGTQNLGGASSPLLRQKIPVHRASGLLAEGLLVVNSLVRQSVGDSLPDALADRIAAARLTAAALYSGSARVPFLLDLDHLAKVVGIRDTLARGHVGTLRKLWRPLRTLSNLDMMGPLHFLSSTPDGSVPWARVRPGLYITHQESALLKLLVPETMPSDPDLLGDPPVPLLPASDRVPLPLFHTLAPDLEQSLDRQAGRVTFTGIEGPGAPTFQLHLPALALSAGPAAIRTQNLDLELGDAFCVALFGDSLPFRHERMPPEATLTADEFRVGNIPVVKRGDGGRWEFQAHGTAVVRHIFGEPAFHGARVPDLSAWSATTGTYTSRLPADTLPDARSPMLRVFVQMEDDAAIHAAGATLSRIHPNELVWVQLHPDGSYKVVRGQSLLANAMPDARVKLIVNGHGHTSWITKERLLSGRSATDLAVALKGLMTRLETPDRPLPKISSVDLLSCSLETPATLRSFGREFTSEAVTQALGRPGMETTVYTDTVLLDYGHRRLRKGTRPHPQAPAVRRAAGKTWVYWSDPDTGSLRVRDKYPDGGVGEPARAACCVVLDGAADDRATERFHAFARARIGESFQIRRRFKEVVDQHRPAGMVLLPRIDDLAEGPLTLTYLDLSTDATVSRTVTAPADRQALRAGIAVIHDGLSQLETRDNDVMSAGRGLDLLNVGMLALSLKDLSTNSPEGMRYQGALWYLGVAQQGLQAGADVAAMVADVRAAMSQSQLLPMDGLVRTSNQLSRALSTLGGAAQAGVLMADLNELVQALNLGTSTDVSRATVKLVIDSEGLLLAGAAAVADLLGASLLAAAADCALVPITGLGYGIVELNRAVTGAIARVDRNLRPLRQINRGYIEPLRRVRAGPTHGAEVLLANGWAPMKRIDFRKGEVVFADASMGASALQASQLYWQAGSRRLHDWWVADGSDRQATYARDGLDMDLWTLMRTADRATVPRVPLPRPLRDPGLVLVLMTSPNVRIHHDGYSSSRAGGDFSLLHDDLIERMQVNSDARFVGDYVTSSSFAKSADLWRYEYLSTLLEVVLDDQNRVLALPAASEAEGNRFVFDDQNARTLLPLDQSLVHLRLLGGGGRYTLALPPDGTVRNPVIILPATQGRDVWTFMRKGGLARGGQPVDFIDGDQKGVRIGGQELRFEALNDAVIQLADPLVPDVRVLLDLDNRRASLMLALPAWSTTLRPETALRKALIALAPPAELRPDSLFLPLAQEHIHRQIHLSSSLEDGEALSGLMDPVSGAAALHSKRHLMLFRPGATIGTGAWARYDLRGGEVSLDPEGRPMVRYDGGHFLQPITYTFRQESGEFAREPVMLTDAGEEALMRWLRGNPRWTPQRLTTFLNEQLAAGTELAGPDGGPPQPLEAIEFSDRLSATLRPSGGASFLALWGRVDALEQSAAGAPTVSLAADPTLAGALSLAGVGVGALRNPGVQALSSDDIALTKQWLILHHAQAYLAAGTAPADLLPALPRLTAPQRLHLQGLVNRLQHLLDQHLAGRDHGSAWIRLGATPPESSELVHLLRDAGVDIRIDVYSLAADSHSTDRDGPHDYYDVLPPTLRLFMQDLTDQLTRDDRSTHVLASTGVEGLVDSPLQQALTAWAAEPGTLRAEGRMGGLPQTLLDRIRRAGLTVRDPSPGLSGSDDAAAEHFAGSTLGRIARDADGWEIESATFRLWQAQAGVQGLPLDAWYARHAEPRSPVESCLRESAATALRDRLIRVRDEMDRAKLSHAPLANDALLGRQLLTALQRLVPGPEIIKDIGTTGGRPGDVFRIDGGDGDARYALMLRPDPAFHQLPPVSATSRDNLYWADIGSARELGTDLRLRVDPDPARPQTFSRGLIEWWMRQLSPAWSPDGYSGFQLDDTGFEATTQGRTHFGFTDGRRLYIRLDDGDTTPFHLKDDADFRAFKAQFLADRAAPALVLIQGNGRPIDLDGATALGAAEIVILEEIDGAPRRIDLDDLGLDDDEAFYEGSDLLIHRPDSGQLIRIRNALTVLSDDPVDDDWRPDPSTRITGQGEARCLAWPSVSRTLARPLLTVRSGQLETTRDDADLLISDGALWDRVRLPDIPASDAAVAAVGADEEPVALLRHPIAPDAWRMAALPASLATLMADASQTSPQRWSLASDLRAADGESLLQRAPDVADGAGRPQGRDIPLGGTAAAAAPAHWRLKAAQFIDAMAGGGGPPGGPPSLALTWQSSPCRSTAAIHATAASIP